MIIFLHLLVTRQDRTWLITQRVGTLHALLRRKLIRRVEIHGNVRDLAPTAQGRAAHVARCRQCAIDALNPDELRKARGRRAALRSRRLR